MNSPICSIFCKLKIEPKNSTKLKPKLFQAGGLEGPKAAKVREKNQVPERAGPKTD